MKKSTWIIALIVALSLLLTSSALASVPQTMTYHGNLSTSAGEPVDDVVEATFRIYDAEAGGSELWSEEMSSIDVVDGSFSATLGATQALSEVFDGGDYWLEITIEGEPLNPRTPVDSVPYAMRAGSAGDAQTLQGVAPEELSAGTEASNIEFDNTDSGLEATDAQAALAELNQRIDDLESALAGKADQSDLDALQSTVADKADQSDLDALQSTVADKAAQSEVDDIDSRLTDAEDELSDNTADIAANATNISSNADAITSLESLTQDMERTTVHGYQSVVFEGVNLHVRNGLGSTDGSDDLGNPTNTEVNGLGNLIVGYDEEQSSDSDKTGSHNLVVGPRHNYSSIGGLIAGFHNETHDLYSSVSAGRFNQAQGMLSSISGGINNVASGDDSSVCGGEENVAEGLRSTVSGGQENSAEGTNSSVSGGLENTASGYGSSVSGGEENEASGFRASVSGGRDNIASGYGSSVSGGDQTTADSQYEWAAGSLSE